VIHTSSHADGLDYTGVDEALVLPVNSINGDTVCQAIDILNDNESEPIEAFFVQALFEEGLSSPSDSALVIIADGK
jgi:hypothetical protein